MTIDERLEVLERELARTRKRQRFSTLAALLALAVLALVGFVNPPASTALARQEGEGSTVIRASKFIVEDEAGHVRATLDGALTLHGEDDNSWVCLTTGLFVLARRENSLWLTVSDTKGAGLRFQSGLKTTAHLQGIEAIPVTPEELEKEVRFRTELRERIFEETRHQIRPDKLAEARAKLIEIMPDPEPGASIPQGLSFQGPERFVALMLNQEFAGLLLEWAGTIRATLNAGNDGSALDLFDAEGRSRATVGASETETPDGKTTRWPESSLLLFGPDGELRWSAP